MKFNVVDADYRSVEGETPDGWTTAVEFLNANEDVNPDTWEDILRKHLDMVELFCGVDGIMIGRYDYRYWATPEASDAPKDYGLTLFVHPELESNVKKASELLDLPVFCINEVTEGRVLEVMEGKEEYQIGLEE